MWMLGLLSEEPQPTDLDRYITIYYLCACVHRSLAPIILWAACTHTHTHTENEKWNMKTDDKAEVEEAKRPQQKRHRRRCLPISNVSYLWPARKFKCGRGPLSILQIHTETETQDAGAAFWMGREMCEFTMRSNAMRCSSWQESAGCDQMWEYVLPSLTASLTLDLPLSSSNMNKYTSRR